MGVKLKEALGPAIGIEDISQKLYPLLDGEIVKAYENIIKRAKAVEYDEDNGDGTYTRRLGEVRYLGVQCKTVEEGIPVLAKKMNKAYLKYKYLGTLGSMSLKLANLEQNNKFIVLSYFLLSEEDYIKLDSDIKDKQWI